MKRREFVSAGVLGVVGACLLGGTRRVWGQAPTDKKKEKISDKDILREGQPTNLANFCENPDKQPNKFCPDAKGKGKCKTCMFYNKDQSETVFKGKTYARCQLLTDPKKPQFVNDQAYCSTYVKQT